MKILKQVIDISPQPAKVINKYNGINEKSFDDNKTMVQQRIIKYRTIFAYKDNFRSNRMIIDNFKRIDRI